ncbi:MAG: hypothetical protein CSB48_02915 [Proteobacteria bacterium]|nr:MAG: hypothetical protein CSB48_02915 [Pseudomonadota bacterium]
MSLTTAGKNMALDALGITAVSLHTGAPGDTGAANEVSGGSYARQTMTFSAAASGSRDSSVQPVFDIPAGTTVSHYALWAGSTCVDAGALSAAETFAADGQYTLTDADISLS